MGKSNNPAKRAEQERAIQARKTKGKRGAGFMKFVLIGVLIIAVCGPFFAGLTNLALVPAAPAAPATIPATAPANIPVPATIPATVAPATSPAADPAPAGQ